MRERHEAERAVHPQPKAMQERCQNVKPKGRHPSLDAGKLVKARMERPTPNINIQRAASHLIPSHHQHDPHITIIAG